MIRIPTTHKSLESLSTEIRTKYIFKPVMITCAVSIFLVAIAVIVYAMINNTLSIAEIIVKTTQMII